VASNLRTQPKLPRRAGLAASLLIALGMFESGRAVDAKQAPTLAALEMDAMLETAFQSAPPVVRNVVNCNDDGTPGTLRTEIEAAANGDTIDLTQLACSAITLGFPIHVTQDSLYLRGPVADTLTISGGDQFPVFQHTGIGTLDISNLKISHGYNFSNGWAAGGCIYSAANVSLKSSEVSSCVLVSAGSRASGAGIYTAGDLTLISSIIADNHAIQLGGTPSLDPAGGGAYVNGTLFAKYTTFSGNSAHQLNTAMPNGHGGGVYLSAAAAQIESSTFSGNTSDICGAIQSIVTGPLIISNSTISGNSAIVKGGGICGDQGVAISNSTIAFNKDPPDSGYGSGMSIGWSATMTLESTIVANNVGSSDIAGIGGSGIVGSHNLVTSSDLGLPADTLQTCARLDRLADNGGPARTHALLLGSAAIDRGSNDTNLVHDERGADRVIGTFADIGAFERQIGAIDDRVFADDFENNTDRNCSP